MSRKQRRFNDIDSLCPLLFPFLPFFHNAFYNYARARVNGSDIGNDFCVTRRFLRHALHQPDKNEGIDVMVESESILRKQIVLFGRLMHRRGLVAATDGNISVRLGPDRILITRSGINKGFLTANDLVVTDQAGKPVDDSPKPSSEILLHLKVYELRPDVEAIIHAHPPLAVALTIAGISLADPILPEVVLTMGKIPTAPYATPSSPEGPAAIENLITNHEALLLERHGSLTVGRTLERCYNLLEKIEHAAQVVLAAETVGGASRIPPEQLAKLGWSN
jgi:L-fuculose-phosphate aldolase